MSNPFRSKREISDNKPTRFYSSRQEKSVASAIDGKITPNSGATPWIKGDVSSDKWLYECKTCVKSQKQFTLKEEWFIKNKQEQVFMGKDYNAVVFNFGPDKPNYYVIDEETFKELIGN